MDTSVFYCLVYPHDLSDVVVVAVVPAVVPVVVVVVVVVLCFVHYMI